MRRQDFGQRLLRAREVRGLLQDEVSQALTKQGLKVDATQLSKWESGHRFPRLDTFAALCKLYVVNGHWLLTGEGAMEFAPDDAAQRLADIIRIASTFTR